MRYFRGRTMDGQPAALWTAIQDECAKYPEFIVEVRKYDPAREISLQQMKWLHCDAGPFAVLADYMGCSRLIAEQILKKKCGEEMFVREIDGDMCILSKTTLSVKQCNVWIDNIFEWMETINCPAPPPDPNWAREKKQRKDLTSSKT